LFHPICIIAAITWVISDTDESSKEWPALNCIPEKVYSVLPYNKLENSPSLLTNLFKELTLKGLCLIALVNISLLILYSFKGCLKAVSPVIEIPLNSEAFEYVLLIILLTFSIDSSVNINSFPASDFFTVYCPPIAFHNL